MSNESLISDQRLIALAGEPAFARGLDYFEQGLVIGWNKKGSTITAEVQGGKLYRVTLTHTKSQFDGSCDCPASEGFDFCKHCVAAALAYRAEQAEQIRLAGGDSGQRLRAYVQKLDRKTLEDSLLELIEGDRLLKQQWSIRADSALGRMDHKALKKRITAALPYNRQLVRYSQVRTYFAGAEPVIDLLAEQAQSLPAEQCLQLVDYALTRLARALETIDDSGGFRFHCEQTLQELHAQTLSRMEWPPEKLAEYLYGLAFGDARDFYPGIPEAYDDALGEEGLEAYYALLQRNWDSLPNLPAGADWEQKYPYLRLRDPLLARAGARGDFPAMVALYQKTAAEARDFLKIAELCMQHDAWDQAELWLARARKARDPDRKFRHSNKDLERLQIRLLLHRGDARAAAELQWDIYRETQRLEDYRYLLQLTAEYRLPTNYAGQARDYLRSQITAKPPGRFYSNHADKLLEILLFDGELEAAWELSREHPLSSKLKLQLARALNEQPQKSMPLYLNVVHDEVQRGNNDGYRNAIALLQELHGDLQAAELRREFGDSLRQLRVKFKAKRNFIKWLNEAFAQD